MPSHGSVAHSPGVLEAGDENAVQKLRERYVEKRLKLARRKVGQHSRQVV